MGAILSRSAGVRNQTDQTGVIQLLQLLNEYCNALSHFGIDAWSCMVSSGRLAPISAMRSLQDSCASFFAKWEHERLNEQLIWEAF